MLIKFATQFVFLILFSLFFPRRYDGYLVVVEGGAYVRSFGCVNQDRSNFCFFSPKGSLG